MTTPNETTSRWLHVLEIDVEFPYGISAGAGSLGNRIQLARNGRGDLILHATAIVGVLRHAYERLHKDIDLSHYFGAAQGDDTAAQMKASPLKVDDAILTTGISKDGDSIEYGSIERGPIERVSHLRCRHTGTVVDGALYSIEATPPKTSATLRFQFEERTEKNQNTGKNQNTEPLEGCRFLREIVGLFERGILFGGNSNRGIGMARIKECTDKNGTPLRYKCYNLACKTGFAEWLNDDYNQRRNGGKFTPDTSFWEKDKKEKSSTADKTTHCVQFTLEIPDGQDLLISNGKGLDAESEPHRVTGSDGKDYWLLPGSSLHGLFRSWITRLAAREGKTISDSIDNFTKNNGQIQGDDSGWMYQRVPNNPVDFLSTLDEAYPVESMFGSLHKAGRLHISDSLSPVGSDLPTGLLAADAKYPVQYRVHVAIDPISGGAIEGALFDNYVLTNGGGDNRVRFPVTILLRDAKETEVDWLVKTLKAIHSGLLRVGSSKSSGRLSVVNNTLFATGPCREKWDNFFTMIEGVWEQMKNDTSDVPPAVAPLPELHVIADASNDTPVPSLKGVLKTKKKVKYEKVDYLYFVTYTNANGKLLQDQPIRQTAKCFRDNDAKDGMEIDIVVEKGQIVKVTIPGKAVVSPTPVVNRQPQKNGRTNVQANGERNTNMLGQALPSVLGMPFHNSYTFIPFSNTSHPERREPTLQTEDERKTKDERMAKMFPFTGTLELKLTTLSPLLTSEGWSTKARESVSRGENDNVGGGHKSYKALKIGENVIVPATGVRGFLRQLLTIVTGGPISVMEENTYYCQGRDLQLTPPNKNCPAILARVVKPGNSKKSGTIVIGETVLISEVVIKSKFKDYEEYRPVAGKKIKWLWANWDGTQQENNRIVSISTSRDHMHTAQIKLSGPPIGRAIKKEGVFIRELATIELPASCWSAYNSRNLFGPRPELKKDDLIWIEPTMLGAYCEKIKSKGDIASLQWARWGRRGKKINEIIPPQLIPDSHRDDSEVSPVTDLFGQVPIHKGSKGKIFKGRIVCDNLVFSSGTLDEQVALAVMGTPHPGCAAFYRNNTNPKTVSGNDFLRGYKVYRMEMQKENQDKPWLFTTQGVYDAQGNIEQNAEQNVNITVDLLKAGATGTVTLSLRSLSRDELALILYACHVKWRLGGGKPLSLGVCRITEICLRDENGKPNEGKDYPAMTEKTIMDRFEYWKKTQVPVALLRYPRAVVRNGNKNTRGGMSWFQKCASPKKGIPPQGLTPIYVCDDLMRLARQNGAANSALSTDADIISGQTLPFIPNCPEREFLYGYDAFFVDTAQKDDPTTITDCARRSSRFCNKDQDCYPKITQFTSDEHISGHEASGPNVGPNAEKRTQDRNGRS